MAQALILCPCGLAKDELHIDDELVAYTCEHCDVPCEDKPCALCAMLSRVTA